MGTEFLGDVEAIWIALALLAAMLALHELAYRRASRLRTLAGADADGSSIGLDSAISLLLGLLLAFSFSMAAGRYEERQGLVIAEANAIGTAWLRCDLLEETTRGRAGARGFVAAGGGGGEGRTVAQQFAAGAGHERRHRPSW